MKQTLLILFSCFSLFSFSQDSASVLFIGNSYTAYNNLPQMVEDLAASLGDVVVKDANTPGGATFEMHSNNATNYALINSQAWDYVVFQGQSQEPSFPDAQVNSQTLPYVMELADSVYASNFCTEVMYYMTWGRENGDPQWQPISTYEGMQARLRSAYLRFADSVQGSVSPVGVAWKHVRDNYPGIQLYTADESHPSIHGSYLAACTFYTSIFRKPCTGATYTMGIDPTIAGQLQAAADFVVLDSLDRWNLHDQVAHTQADFGFTVGANGEVSFDNLSTKAQSYSWDFGDGQTSSDENPVITYNSNGTYTVTLTATSECNVDIITYQVDVQTASLQEGALQIASLKSLGNGKFEVISNITIEQIEISDAAGNRIHSISNNSIDLSQCAAGLYLVRVMTTVGEEVFKLSR
ncbi:MAG: PKD domain-containing protein [bacterium]|nr:PKD domain-containing protein [bacterium]